MLSDIWASATRADFPSTIQEIIDLIGLKSVCNLYRYFLANPTERRDVIRRLYIPKRVRPDHLISQLIGVENFEKLSFHWGGLWIDFPHCKSLVKRIRDEEIRRLVAEGQGKGSRTDVLFSVARQFDLSAETIKSICRGGEG